MIRNTIRTTLGKEPVRPSQRSSVETPRQPAPEAPTVRCLVDQAWLAPVGRRRSWWAARTVIRRNPTRSRPRTDVGTPEHERATISRQHKPHQLREVIGTGTWNTRTMRTIGKVEIVESEMHRMKIGCLGLAETRWSGKDDCHGRMFNGDLLWIRKS